MQSAPLLYTQGKRSVGWGALAAPRNSDPRMLFMHRFARTLQCLLLLLFLGSGWRLASAQGVTRTLTGTLAAAPEPSGYTANFTLTATLVPPAGGPGATGTVIFSVDGAAVGSSAVTGNAAAYTVTSSTYPVGAHTISAAYSGDTNYDPLTLNGTHNIRKLQSAMDLQVLTPTLYYGQTVDATASVSAVEASPTSTLNGGTITFYADGVNICQLPVTGQQEYCPNSAGQGFHAGKHTLQAVYSGNDYYDGSSSPIEDFTVLPDDTQAALTSSLNPSTLGLNVTFTAALTAPYAVPVGTVTFYDGTTPIGTGTLDANGKAAASTSTLSVGAHDITVRYAPSPDFNASVSPVLEQIVQLPTTQLPATATLLSSSANPSTFGQSVTFTAAVATTGAFMAVPAGTVTFNDGSTLLGTGTLDKSGVATFTTSKLAVGQHPITAAYGGSSTLAASTSATLLQQVVTPLTSAGYGFQLIVTPTSINVGAGSSVSVSVQVVPLNGFNLAVQLSCTGLPNEAGCTFDNTTIPPGGGATRLVVSASAPHNCGSSTPYFVAGGGWPAMLAAAALVFGSCRRKSLLKALALAIALCVLPALSGCSGNCTDLGTRPGDYSFTVVGDPPGPTAVAVTGPPVSRQTQVVQMKVHI